MRPSIGSAALPPSPRWARSTTAKVVKVLDFGAFVNYMGTRDGLVHISQLARERVGKVADVVKVGDEVKVKLIGIDDRGKVKLSMRDVDQATGEEDIVKSGQGARATRSGSLTGPPAASRAGYRAGCRLARRVR